MLNDSLSAVLLHRKNRSSRSLDIKLSIHISLRRLFIEIYAEVSIQKLQSHKEHVRFS